MSLTALDRAIAFLSPRRAYERVQYRAALEMHARAYDAAKTGRRGEGWVAGGTSANTEIAAAAATIRARARDLARNNPYAAAVVSKMTASVWGTGIVPRLNVKDKDDPRRLAARDIWNWFTDNSDPEGQLDFYGQIALGIRAMTESGEFLVRRVWRSADFGPVPFQIRILEGDYIDTTQDKALPNGGAIIQGVEFDATGRRAAYWLFDEHPGEMVRAFSRRAFQSTRVPASDVRHVFEPLRPGQARGVSVFTPVVLKFRDLDDFEDARLMQQKVAACFAAFVVPPIGPAQSALAGTGGTKTSTAGDRIETMKPGMVKYLGNGEEVKFATPPSTDGYVDFVRSHLRAAAAGCGITYEMISGDLSGVNFSSIRIGRNDFLDRVDQLQWLTVIPQLCNPIWKWVGDESALAGARGAGDSWAATWTTPARRMMSPKEDIDAGVAEVRAGRKSLFDLIAETGEHPEEKLEEIARVNALLDELGIVSDADPRKVGKTSTPNPSAATPPEKETA